MTPFPAVRRNSGKSLGNYWDLYWVLDDNQQRLLLTLEPDAYSGDVGTWAIVRAQTLWLRGDTARARVYADSPHITYAARTRATPGDAQQYALGGLALAYLGRFPEAIAEGKRAVALAPVDANASDGLYYLHELARIYLLAGQQDKALDLLEPLLKLPYFLSAEWLRIDPALAPLRGNPRFEKLVAGA